VSLGAPFDLGEVVGDAIWLDVVESTNSYLAGLSPSSSSRVVATWNQTGGRGRLGRQWVSPPGKSLALSLELWPEVIPEHLDTQWLGSLSLVTGVALARAIAEEVASGARVKWPNDVLIDGKKVAGVLGEIPQPRRVIVGVGLNVFLDADELPTSWATSLNQHGVSDLTQAADVVRSFLSHLHEALTEAKDGLSPRHSARIEAFIETIGQEVRAEFPDGTARTGEALGIDESGRLRVHFSDTGQIEVVDSADVWHLRPAR
jgi:BirA family biotin operon repressor/biotin-[acetyl-CoA-carboxylase] ligase